MSRGRHLLGAAAALGAPVLSGPDHDAVTGHDAPAPVAAAEARPLPLHEYSLSEAQARTVDHAHGLLLARCLARAGVAWPVPDLRDEPLPADRRYGLSSPAAARAHGYDRPPASRAERAALALNSRSLSDDEAAALQGCERDEEVVRLTRLAVAPDPAELGLYRAALRSADGTAVVDDWRRCMRRSGHRTDSDEDRVWIPVGVGSDLEQDRRTAVDDVACKQRLDVAGRLHAVESRLQQRYVAAHAVELLGVRRQVRRLVAVASEVIAGAERSTGPDAHLADCTPVPWPRRAPACDTDDRRSPWRWSSP